MSKVEAHLMSKHRFSARTRAIGLYHTLIENAVEQILVLFHKDNVEVRGDTVLLNGVAAAVAIGLLMAVSLRCDQSKAIEVIEMSKPTMVVTTAARS